MHYDHIDVVSMLSKAQNHTRSNPITENVLFNIPFTQPFNLNAYESGDIMSN